jgi:hypothetical protein
LAVNRDATGLVTVRPSGADTVAHEAAGAAKLFVSQFDAPTNAASWTAVGGSGIDLRGRE